MKWSFVPSDEVKCTRQRHKVNLKFVQWKGFESAAQIVGRLDVFRLDPPAHTDPAAPGLLGHDAVDIRHMPAGHQFDQAPQGRISRHIKQRGEGRPVNGDNILGLAEQPDLVGDGEVFGEDGLETPVRQKPLDLGRIAKGAGLAARDEDLAGQGGAVLCLQGIQRRKHLGRTGPGRAHRAQGGPGRDVEQDATSADARVAAQGLESKAIGRRADIAGRILGQDQHEVRPVTSQCVAQEKDQGQMVVQEMREILGAAPAQIHNQPRIDLPLARAAQAGLQAVCPRCGLGRIGPEAVAQDAAIHRLGGQGNHLAIRNEAVDQKGLGRDKRCRTRLKGRELKLSHIRHQSTAFLGVRKPPHL